MTEDEARILMIGEIIVRCPNCRHSHNDYHDVEVYSPNEPGGPAVWICSRCEYVGVHDDFFGHTSVQRKLY